MFGFFSAAHRRKLCTARCPSIWYLLFIATLSFSWQKMTLGPLSPGVRVATFYELTDILMGVAGAFTVSAGESLSVQRMPFHHKAPGFDRFRGDQPIRL